MTIEVLPSLQRRPGMDASMRADTWPIAGVDSGAYLAHATLFLGGAVGLVFLVLCANVTTLLLARAGGRAREFSTCVALGASRSRLLRQAFTESLALGVGGLAAGCGIGWLLVGLAQSWLPDAIVAQTLNPVDLDSRALAMASVAGLGATIAVSMLPASFGTDTGGAAAATRHESQSSTQSKFARSCTHGLLVAEIAFGTTLLLGTVLLVASFVRLADVDRGLDARGVVTGFAELPEGVSGATLDSTLRTVPGVSETTFARQQFSHYGDGFVPDSPGSGPVEVWTSAQVVAPNYFDFYAIRLLRGRTFEEGESPSNVVISERFADAMWPGQDPVGRSFRFHDDRYEVIGVVTETRLPSLDRRRDLAELYLPGSPLAAVAFSVRCEPACDNSALLRRRITAAAPVLGIYRLEVLEHRYDAELARPRAAAIAAIIFAGIAVMAAAGGLFSVLSYAVSRRRRELGIRASLGARPAVLQRMVFREGAWMAAAGLALGGLAGMGVSRILASVLFEVSPAEPSIWFVVAGLIGATTLLATWLPARRASGIDPSGLLREP